MARCSISLLGTMRFTLDGNPLRGLESGKVRALLAYLAVESGQAHERERLAGLFWPEISEAQARHSLSQSLHNLRQALGEAGKTGDLSGQPGGDSAFLLLTPQTVQFNPHSDHFLDVRAFEQALAEVHRHAHRRLQTCAPCARLMVAAGQLYQGDFLSGFSLRGCQAFEEWALVRRERLQRQMCEILAALSRYYEARNELGQALELTERRATMDPFNESAHRDLMRRLALLGQRTQALARYESFRRNLLAELGVEPAKEMQLLYQRILKEETSQASLPGMPGRLPVPLTPFVGREDELAELSAWVRDPQVRLITVLGPGGSGKTRLALQAAHSLRYDFPDGIFLVPLSGAGSSEAFLPALASALGVTFTPGWGDPLSQLLGYLHNRRMLLILDSFEEMPGASRWVTGLLQGTASLQILTTSRARLNVHAEQVFPLEGLSYPDPARLEGSGLELSDYSALQLFSSAAGQVRPNATPSAAELPALARICQLVAGMPLGIILAAGWLATCTAAEIAEEIQRSLDFLSARWSDLPERQRSLRATLDHSWNLLSGEERQAFQKLSVFQGVFTRQAAGQVAGVSAAGLRGLVDKSMLQAAAGSYRLHDLLRQYGAEKLAADEAAASQVCEAHSVYYLERLAGYEPLLKSARRSQTLSEMDAEINDLQAAWRWACLRGDIARLGRGLSGLGLYYEMRVRYAEGIQACQACLSGAADELAQGLEAAVLRVRLLLWQANFRVLSGKLETASELHRQAGLLLDRLEAMGVDTRRPRAMYWQAEGEAQPDLRLKLDSYHKGIALYQALGDGWRQASMLVWAGEYAMRMGDPGLALASQQEALQLARQFGEPDLLLHCLRQSTYLYSALSRPEDFRRMMQETVTVLESVEELPLRANAQMHLGMQYNHIGQFAEGIRLLEQSVPVLRSLNYRYGMAFGELSLGLGYVMNRQYERGAALLQSAYQVAEQGGFMREAVVSLHVLGMVAVVQGRLEQALDHFSQGVERYRSMQFAGELGMGLGGLSLAQAAAGQVEAARENLREALEIAEQTRNMSAIFLGSPALVFYFARCGPLETAVLLHRLLIRIPFHHNSLWYADVIGDEMDAHWQALSPQQQAAIDASLQAHTPFTILPQVLSLLANQS